MRTIKLGEPTSLLDFVYKEPISVGIEYLGFSIGIREALLGGIQVDDIGKLYGGLYLISQTQLLYKPPWELQASIQQQADLRNFLRKYSPREINSLFGRLTILLTSEKDLALESIVCKVGSPVREFLSYGKPISCRNNFSLYFNEWFQEPTQEERGLILTRIPEKWGDIKVTIDNVPPTSKEDMISYRKFTS